MDGGCQYPQTTNTSTIHLSGLQLAEGTGGQFKFLCKSGQHFRTDLTSVFLRGNNYYFISWFKHCRIRRQILNMIFSESFISFILNLRYSLNSSRKKVKSVVWTGSGLPPPNICCWLLALVSLLAISSYQWMLYCLYFLYFQIKGKKLNLKKGE